MITAMTTNKVTKANHYVLTFLFIVLFAFCIFYHHLLFLFRLQATAARLAPHSLGSEHRGQLVFKTGIRLDLDDDGVGGSSGDGGGAGVGGDGGGGAVGYGDGHGGGGDGCGGGDGFGDYRSIPAVKVPLCSKNWPRSELYHPKRTATILNNQFLPLPPPCIGCIHRVDILG